jgi:hypothetical protein
MSRPSAAWRVDQPGDLPPLFYVKLVCGCTYPVDLDMLNQEDFPCPTHEERRFFGTDNFQIIGDVEVPPASPYVPPSEDDGDDWVGEPH